MDIASKIQKIIDYLEKQDDLYNKLPVYGDISNHIENVMDFLIKEYNGGNHSLLLYLSSSYKNLFEYFIRNKMYDEAKIIIKNHIMKYFVKKYQYGKNGIKVWRKITLDSDKIPYEGYGIYWSFLEKSAKPYEGKMGTDLIATFIGEIPFDSIDWGKTVKNNLEFGITESEITGIKNSKIWIEKIRVCEIPFMGLTTPKCMEREIHKYKKM